MEDISTLQQILKENNKLINLGAINNKSEHQKSSLKKTLGKRAFGTTTQRVSDNTLPQLRLIDQESAFF